jgi:hypothetical protein
VQHFLSLVSYKLEILIEIFKTARFLKYPEPFSSISAPFIPNYKEENVEFIKKWLNIKSFAKDGIELRKTWQAELLWNLWLLSEKDRVFLKITIFRALPSLNLLLFEKPFLSGCDYASTFKTGAKGWVINIGEEHRYEYREKKEVKTAISFPIYLFSILRTIPETVPIHLWLELQYISQKDKTKKLPQSKESFGPLGFLQTILRSCISSRNKLS